MSLSTMFPWKDNWAQHKRSFIQMSFTLSHGTIPRLQQLSSTHGKQHHPKSALRKSIMRHPFSFGTAISFCIIYIYIPQITFEVITDLSTFLPAAVSTQKYKQVQGKTSLTQDVPTSVSKHACHMLSPSPETGNHSNPDNSLFFKFYLYLFISI